MVLMMGKLDNGFIFKSYPREEKEDEERKCGGRAGFGSLTWIWKSVYEISNG